MKRGWFLLAGFFALLLLINFYPQIKIEPRVTGNVVLTTNGFIFDSAAGNVLNINTSDGTQILSLSVLYGDGTNFLGSGGGASTRLIVSNNKSLIFDGETDRYFVVSSASDSKSYIIKAANFKQVSGANKTTFQYWSDGSWTDLKMDAIVGDSVNIGSSTFQVISINYNDRSVAINTTNDYFNRFYDISGRYLYLPGPNIFPTSEFILNISQGNGGSAGGYMYKAYWNGGAINFTRTCSESDGGINYYVYGGAGNDTINILDSCSGQMLTESYCNLTLSSSNVFTTTYNCSANGKVCSNGACSCTPNWTAKNTTCVSDSLTTWYNDTNSCGGAAGRPENTTYDCDSDNNGIIGNVSDIETGNIDSIDFFIEGNALNISKVYRNVSDVKIEDNDTVLVEFSHNFSSQPLNLKKIVVRKQPDSSLYGYLIVNGISDEKTFHVKKIGVMNQICVKDSEIGSVNSISSDCDGTNEQFIECPYQYGDYPCNLSGSYLIVSGLRHSAVKQFSSFNATVCTPNWSCTSWSSCRSGRQTRTCRDTKGCGSLVGRPILNQTCSSIVAPSCVSNWTCGAWLPDPCPESGNQTRTCVDKNKCGSTTKTESKGCQYVASSNIWIFVIVGIVVVILVVIAIILIVLIKERRDYNSANEPYTPPKIVLPPSPPSSPSKPIPSSKPSIPNTNPSSTRLPSSGQPIAPSKPLPPNKPGLLGQAQNGPVSPAPVQPSKPVPAPTQPRPINPALQLQPRSPRE